MYFIVHIILNLHQFREHGCKILSNLRHKNKIQKLQWKPYSKVL